MNTEKKAYTLSILVEDTTGPSESTTETGAQSRSRNMPIQ